MQTRLDAAIIGAGPYGLSLAAHFRRSGMAFRIFGRPMESWLAHMPKGMMLKSDGFASNLYDPDGEYALAHFCAERGIPYADTGVPVRLDTFTAYGLAFRDRMAPELEHLLVSDVARSSDDGFVLRLENGEEVRTRRVVLAVGITHFDYVPPTLAGLPAEFVTHSSQHHELDGFRARRVVVIGAGASALDLAGLLHQAGADVQLVSRRTKLRFHSGPSGKPRSRWQQIRHPQSGLGPGMRSRFFSDAPLAFHCLPARLRVEAVRRTLGPSGGWFSKDLVIGRVPLLLGYSPQSVRVQNGKAVLAVRGSEGETHEIEADHIITATGYRVDLSRLAFLRDDIRSQVATLNGMPTLSSAFESSVPGLYFAGLAAATSFGPVMRFAYGAGFAASRITNVLEKALSRERAFAPRPSQLTDKATPLSE